MITTANVPNMVGIYCCFVLKLSPYWIGAKIMPTGAPSPEGVKNPERQHYT